MSNQNNITNVYVNSAPPVIVRSQPGCLIQIPYFLLIGWWLGAAAIVLAYFLFLTLLGIPLGVTILNKIPYLLALRQTEPTISYYGAKTVQHNLLIRALWFFMIGSWVTIVWLFIGYVLACTIIGMPLAFWMFDKAPVIFTLHKS